MNRKSSTLFLLIVLCSFNAYADVSLGNFSLSALLDFRFVHASSTTSWLDRGLGKTRYGGSNGEDQNLFRLSQASILFSGSLTQSFFARAQMNVDAEPAGVWKRHRVDLIEGYFGYRHVFTPYFRLRIRGGFFFPPVSLENRDAAWTNPYTITSSSINSWIGEEVRVVGGEASLLFQKNGNEFSFSASVFGKNDPTASLLAWRGWSLSDRQTGLTDRLPLASIPSFGPGGLFPRQPEYVQPFREVDGRAGYYGAFSWTNRHFELNGLHYDNRGIETSFDGSQYAWDTAFGDVGIAVHLPANFEMLTQFLGGSSKMGFHSMVNINYRAGYLMLSRTIRQNRLSFRYDTFRVNDRDRFVAVDNNNESGHAWTFAYLYSFDQRYRAGAELLRVNSSRPERPEIGLPPHATETLFQISLRVRL